MFSFLYRKLLAKRILYNFLKVSFSVFIGSGFVFLSQVYLGRTLGVNAYGKLSFYNTIVAYLLLVVNFGFDFYFIKPCLNNELSYNKALSIQITSRLIASIIIFFLCGLLFLSFPRHVNLLLCILISRLLPYTFSLDWYLKSREKFGIVSFQNISRGLSSLILIYTFIKHESDILTAAFILVVVDCISFGIGWVGYKGGKLILISFKEIKNVVKKSFVVSLSFFMISIYYNTDSFVLGLFRSNHEVGVYSAAYKFLLAGIMPTLVLFSIYTPRIASNIHKKKILAEYIKRTVLLGIIITALLVTFSSTLVELTFGSSYNESKRILFFLSLDILPCYLAGALINPLNLWGYHKIYFWIVFCGGMFNIIANFTLIPFFGIPAAITTTILSEVIVAILGFYYITQKLKEKMV